MEDWGVHPRRDEKSAQPLDSKEVASRTLQERVRKTKKRKEMNKKGWKVEGLKKGHTTHTLAPRVFIKD